MALLIVVVPVTILLCVTPGIMRRRQLVKAGAQTVCWLAGASIRQSGWRIPDDFACVVIANHSSYLDGVVLTAALPARFAFLIKQEMAHVPVAGFVLKQIAAEFVDRRNPGDRRRMARRLVETAHRGWTLAVFPEGTFDEHPGLKHFHTGAFAAALSGNLPIVPIVIRGARKKMPSGFMLPRPGPLSIRVCEPLEPRDFGSVEALSAAARRSLLEHLEEPDLEPAATAILPGPMDPSTSTARVNAEQPLWRPAADRAAASEMQRFLDSVREESGARDYRALHKWSITERGRFWSRLWDFTGVIASEKGAVDVAEPDRMPGAGWFPQSRLNFAENLLAGDADTVAIVFRNESGERRELTRAQLRDAVAITAAEFRKLGLEAGDRVAALLPNMPETAIGMLAATSIGAVWSSCSPDFGVRGVLDRFAPIEPKILIGIDGYCYAGKKIDCRGQLKEVAAALPGLAATFIVEYLREDPAVTSNGFRPFPSTTGEHQAEALSFEQLPFNHPVYILHTSGTTGLPKAIVHGAGGTLLQHRKEHVLHTNIVPGKRVFYFTTCGWMMWHWLISSLASGATIVLFDGNPMYPDAGALWRLAEEEQVNVFGTSAKYLSALEKVGYRPADEHALDSLEIILSTGSPLAVSSFEYVYAAIRADVQLSSISGGTDIVSCFILGNPLLPVYAGEIQCAGLGMAVDVFDSAGKSLEGSQGELVCRAPFPSMPIGFWNDPDGSRYHAAYFDRFENVWCHGDYLETTSHGGYIMQGRSDTVLNPGGVRIGTAEIYRVVEAISEVAESIAIGQTWDDDVRVVLFVRMQDGQKLDDAMRERIRKRLREQASPRHVPARIIEVSDIPRTRSGKIVEVAVRDVVHGRTVANIEALANPEALDGFRDLPELQE